MSRAGFPTHEVTKRREDQGGGKGPLPLWTLLSFAGVKYRTESVRKMSGLPNELTLILIKIKNTGNTFHIIPERIYCKRDVFILK